MRQDLSTFNIAAIGAAVLIFVTTPAQAQVDPNAPLPKLINSLLGSENKPHWAQVSTFTVAGVRLGMTPSEAREALKKGGFTPRRSDPTQASWTARLSEAVAQRRGTPVDQTKVPMFTMAEGPQGEHIEIWYATTPQGAVASEIKYQIPANRMTAANFLQSVSEKYGQASAGLGNNRLYCSKTEKHCVKWENKTAPYLEATADYSIHTVAMFYGADFGEDLKTQMSAALEASAPRNAAPTF